MDSNTSTRHPIEEIAEDYAARIRSGEQPTIDYYLRQYPQMADEIRELFPTLEMMEGLAPSSANATQKTAAVATAARTIPKRLGEFRIVSEIGRGGMGVVYEAVQEPLGRAVALKVLPSHFLEDHTQRERFLREAQSAAKLHHTNIVPVFAVGEQDGVPFYAMQYIRGQGLNDVIAEHSRERAKSSPAAISSHGKSTLLTSQLARGVMTSEFNVDDTGDNAATAAANEATAAPANNSALRNRPATYFRSVAQIGIQAAEALTYAHQHGILHRDIKPANLLLDTEGVLWVMDFGLAKTEGAQNLTASGDVVGTLRYLAPERFTGAADARSDIYSLGLTLYEMLALQPAYDESDRNQLLLQVMRDEPPRLRKLVPGLPRDLGTIVHKCLQRDPQQRYRSAKELADDLRRFCDAEPIRARRISPAERVWRWVRQRPALAALAAVSILAVLSAGAFLVYFNLSQQLQQSLSAEQVAKGREQQARKSAEKAKRRAEIAESTAKRSRHNTALLTSHIEWQRGNILVARRLQDSIPDAFRDWEWRFLKRVFHQESFVHSFNSFFPERVALNHDGSRLACWSMSSPGGFHIVDTASGKLLWQWQNKKGRNWSRAAVTANGETFAVATSGRFGQDRLIEIGDVATGRIHHTVAMPENGGGSLYFNGDGTRLGEANSRMILDTTKGKVLFTLEGKGWLRQLAFAPKGQLIAGSANKKIFIWDGKTGKLVRSWDDLGAGGELQFPHPQTLRSASSSRFITWDVRTGKPRQTVQNPSGRFGGLVALGPKAQYLAATDNRTKTINLVYLATNKVEISFRGTTATFASLAFSGDGKYLAAGGYDKTARLFLVQRESATRVLKSGPRPQVSTVAFHPDGEHLATNSSAKEIKIWNVESGQPQKTISMPLSVSLVRCNPKGNNLYCVSHFDKQGIRHSVVNSVSMIGKLQWTSDEFPFIRALAVHPDERHIVFASDKTVYLWDIVAKKATRTIPHAVIVNGVAISSDGNTLATGADDKRVRVWNLKTGKLQHEFAEHPGKVLAVAFSPNHELLASGDWEGFVKIWNVRSGQLQHTLTGHIFSVGALAWHKNGAGLISGGADSHLNFWDSQTGQLVLSIPSVHMGLGKDIAVSADGRRVAVPSNAGAQIFSD